MLILVAAGMRGSGRVPQANIRIASITQVTLVSAVSAATTFRPAASPARYVVQPGDTLSGIAAALAVRGGWPALYAANRPLIGRDPNVIHAGAVLVLPGRSTLLRYRVAVGDTLSRIAAALAVRGGWPALYAANRPIIGPDPNAIQQGIELTISRPAAPAARVSSHGRARHRISPPAAPEGGGHRRLLPGTRAHASVMPRWLKIVLLAAALLIGSAFLAEQVVVIGRRRRRGSARTRQPDPTQARIVLADYDQLVVTHSKADNTVYVLRPPGEDPKAIMRVARLVVAESLYRELAEHLGLPPSWPIVMADYHRLVVTCSTVDDAVYVLRPPGEDPRAVLRAARLVLPEDHYEELASQLGVAASWPAE